MPGIPTAIPSFHKTRTHERSGYTHILPDSNHFDSFLHPLIEKMLLPITTGTLSISYGANLDEWEWVLPTVIAFDRHKSINQSSGSTLGSRVWRGMVNKNDTHLMCGVVSSISTAKRRIRKVSKDLELIARNPYRSGCERDFSPRAVSSSAIFCTFAQSKMHH